MALCVAVDGPAGAGKSAAARELARRLGILHLDTGAMYRAVGLAALEAGIDLADAEAVARVSASAEVDVTFENGRQRTWLNGRDVSGDIRMPEAAAASSMVSAVGAVRDAMAARQRAIASGTGAVLDGRDIGTRVLPDAPVKFFLTASPKIRARRRLNELLAKGIRQTFEQALADVEARDLRDTTREIDPLRPASDAIIIDNSEMTLDEEVGRMLEIARHKVNI
ncbi:MAG: (d)CMP kinase [Oscillospiraceae bacterium]|jgi:cytidylate kinase|nr:(d)CMP kinase [Oscillospiraceae bacterium]